MGTIFVQSALWNSSNFFYLGSDELHSEENVTMFNEIQPNNPICTPSILPYCMVMLFFVAIDYEHLSSLGEATIVKIPTTDLTTPEGHWNSTPSEEQIDEGKNDEENTGHTNEEHYAGYSEETERKSNVGSIDSGEVLPTSGSALPTSGNVLPASGENFPSSGEIPSSSGDMLPSSDEILPTSEEVLPTSEEVLPTSEDALPTSEDVLPTSE